MFNTLMSHINNNKVTILLIIIIILIIYVLFMPISHEEHMSTTVDLTNITNKVVSLSCKRADGTYYLGIVKKTDCTVNSKDCHANIAILQKTNNNNTMFRLNKLIGASSYFMTSILPGDPQLSQGITHKDPINYLCFTVGQHGTIQFDIESSKSGYLLKFKDNAKTPTYYYVCECTDSSKCKTGPRLCLYKNNTNAIVFNFEVISTPKVEKFEPSCSDDNSTMDNLSLFSQDSMNSGSIVSVAGYSDNDVAWSKV